MSIGTSFAVILPAAGSGSRFNAGTGGADKLLNDLGGKSVLQRSVGLFASRLDVSLVLIVTTADRFDVYRQHLKDDILPAKLDFAVGGRERWESVLFGLRVLAGRTSSPRYIAIHDAARPLAPASVIDDAFRTALQKGAALPGVPEPATLKRRSPEGTIAETVNRATLYQAQTPQCFELDKLLGGYERLLQQNQVADLTDDAQVYERIGLAVSLTAGSSINLKITTPEDLTLARAMRI